MNNLQANICLFAVTLIWSCEVVIHAAIPHGVNPFATACVTSLIGAALTGVYFYRRIAIALKTQRSLFIKRIVFLGILNSAYNVLYLIGLEYFDVSSGAFAASMAAVILPVMVLLMERTISLRTWISSAIVLIGIVVAMAPDVRNEQMDGLYLMALGALLRSMFIVKLNDYAREHDPVTLATGLTGASAIFSFIPWLANEPTTFLTLPWSPRLIVTYFIFGYFIVAFATVLNIYAQRRASAAHSTIIYSTEIIFSTIWAAILPDSIVDPVAVTPGIVIGCGFVVLGNLVEIIHPRMGWDEEDEALGSVPDRLARTLEVKRRLKWPASHSSEADADPSGHQSLLSRLLEVEPAPMPVRETDSDTMIEVSHPFAAVLDSASSRRTRAVILFVALLLMYLVIALPFKVLEVIPGFTDIRPVYMLYPVYGIFFGLPGCFATAAGNLICDIVSDSLRWSSIAGVITNFLYPFILYVFWSRVQNRPFALRTRKRIARLSLSIIVCAIVTVAILAPSVALLYPEVDIAVFALSVSINSTLFPLTLSLPFMILIQEELGYDPAPPLW